MEQAWYQLGVAITDFIIRRKAGRCKIEDFKKFAAQVNSPISMTDENLDTRFK